MAHKVLTIKTSPNYRSLNLSHAVAIVLYELNKVGSESIQIDNKNVPIPASAREIEDFLKDAERLLKNVGFLLEHTSKARMSKVRILLQRAKIRGEEVSLIRGMVRQIRWALEK